MLHKWNELPKELRNASVKEYYDLLCKKQSSLRVKRTVDCILALILIFVLWPFMIMIALAVKYDSKGPIFYRQERITQYGNVFRIYKFRTMVVDADRQGPLVTTTQDSRITKVGAFLRKYRLDEIPQLLNIITGEMSFVGTRPEVKRYVDQYTPEMLATLLLPAGITSRTSIEFKDEDDMIAKYTKDGKNSVDEVYLQYILPKKMKYNLQYLRGFSIKTDLKIMIKTVLAVLK